MTGHSLPVAQTGSTDNTAVGYPLQRKCACGVSSRSGGECEACAAKRRVQRSAATARRGLVVPQIVDAALRPPRQSLDASTRVLLEMPLGHEFSRVRVLTDTRAAVSALAVNAHPYAVDEEGVFASRRFAKGSRSGQRLRAHELAQVTQPRGGAFTATGAGTLEAAPKRAEQAFDSSASMPTLKPQRKCACGDATHSGSPREERRNQRLMRSGPHGTDRMNVPASVSQVLGSSGRPLDQATLQHMESRFVHDFSRVRVHADAQAAASAQAVEAHAYTFGDHIVFGAERYAPTTSSGLHLLAHELTHVVQQHATATSRPSEISEPDDDAEREADAIAQRILTSGPNPRPTVATIRPDVLLRAPIADPRFGPPPTTAGGPAPTSAPAPAASPAPASASVRGSNPADCLAALCKVAARKPVPNSDKDAIQRVDDWERDALACVRSGAVASNASHQVEIAANEASEIPGEATELRSALRALGSSAGRYRDHVDMLEKTCTSKTSEVRIEFHYNVVFDNPASAATGWGDWDGIDTALAALPPSATWANPKLITFDRAACHPADMVSGRCAGQPAPGGARSFVGGETDFAAGRITIYDQGLGNAAFPRSASLNLPATQQTLRHEVGHVTTSQIPQAEREHFFKSILPWEDYSWAWITSPAPRHANWQAHRDSLRAELGFDEPRLDAWLAALQPTVPVRVGQRTYTRDAAGTGGATLFLSSIDASRFPSGREFEYARTNTGEYLAELYALAVSRPAFLYDALPGEQSAWLKRVLFQTPTSPREWARALAVKGDVTTVMDRLMHTYTWDQAQTIIDEIPTQSGMPGGGQRA